MRTNNDTKMNNFIGYIAAQSHSCQLFWTEEMALIKSEGLDLFLSDVKIMECRGHTKPLWPTVIPFICFNNYPYKDDVCDMMALE